MPHKPTDTTTHLYDLLDDGGAFVQFRNRVFGPDFRGYREVCSYLEKHFGESNYDIHNKWKAMTKASWSAESFQALFIACWIYKPMEKGTYFLRMTPSEARKVRQGFEKLPERRSSHLSKHGRSAHEGWAFLVGYDELLVQWHNTGDRVYLMLKAEGHTTGWSSIVPHMKSWAHKARTGAGLMANETLHELATAESTPIVARGAENFSNEYKTFLKDLGRVKKIKSVKNAKATTSVRDMLSALIGTDWTNRPNRDVRVQLTRLADRPNDTTVVNGVSISSGVKKQFLRFAKLFELENRPDAVYQRFFEEVHVNPDQLDNAIKEFLTWNLPTSTIAQTQRRSEMLRF
ncbi:MAG: hypothetical protein OEX19_09150 [Gammaproteobacteria bacterium]|nr:hypothetical protein [Gammaproteobacteria bacterium]